MLKTLVRQNNHDFLHQYQWIHPLQKIKILQATVQTSNNKLIKEQKNILPIQFFLNLFLAQKPKIKVAKKSNASFKIRPNMIIGTKNHLHNCKLSLFFVRFICSILPLIKLDTNLTKNSLPNKFTFVNFLWIDKLKCITQLFWKTMQIFFTLYDSRVFFG